MRARTPLSVLAAAGAALGLSATVAVAVSHNGGEPLEVVAEGLTNPRGLAVGPEGAVYVAESGSGADDGAVLRYDPRKDRTSYVAEGLPSEIAGEGDAVGPHDVAFQGRGNMYVPIGLGGDPRDRDVGSLLGTLLRISAGGQVQVVSDVAAHEETNPDGGEFEGEPLIDSNPYSAVTLPGGLIAVADAGSNALFLVAKGSGDVETLAVFPPKVVPVDAALQQMLGLPPEFPAEAVPDAVAVGPDGALYVGQLLGFPFIPGYSSVFRVADDGTPEEVEAGFTAIVDIAFDNDGNLYVLEMVKDGLLGFFGGGADPIGALIKVAPDGTRTELAEGQLMSPGGLALAKDGTIYVSTGSVFGPGGGTLVRIDQ